MNNIFKNAYFGKPYKTREGRTVIFSHTFFSKEDNETFAILMFHNENVTEDNADHLATLVVSLDGSWHRKKHTSPLDVVSDEEVNNLVSEEEVTNKKKTMGLYAIYCTEEQTKKALELGAPIEVLYTKADYQQKRPTISIKGEFVDYAYFVPTAEEMIGWLENQGLYFSIECIGNYVYEVWTKDTDKIVIIINSCVHTRKEATLSAIDAALEHLNENQK